MEEKKKKVHIGVVILVIFNLYLLFQIGNLHSQLENLERNLDYKSNELSGKIDSIYHNVDEKLREQASFLSYMNYSYGELNAEEKTVMLAVEVIPKERTEFTELYLEMGQTKAAFEYGEEKYIAQLPVDIFNREDTPLTLSIVNGEITQTEHLYDVPVNYLYEKYLPILSSDMLGSHTYHHQTKTLEVKLDTTLYFYNMNEESDARFEEIYLVKYENGKLKKRENITEEVLTSEDFDYENFHLARKEERTFSGDISKEEWVYCVEAVDSFGFIHECEIYYWCGDDAKHTQHADGQNYGETIYDKDGNILYNGRN